MTSGPPYISVVVVGYLRDAFITTAVDSIFAQERVPRGFEVLVSKSFENPGLDDELRSRGAVVLTNPDPRVGSRLAEAVATARGEVVSFLDDDDTFLPGKLRRVEQLFESAARLGYDRNGMVTIDQLGRAITPTPVLGRRMRALARLGTIELEPGSGLRRLRSLPAVNADFNVSSISIRREILLQRLDWLRAIPLSGDSFCFYSALLSDCRIQLDPAPLTCYRVHGGNLGSARVAPAPRTPGLGRGVTSPLLQSYELMREMARRESRADVVADLDAAVGLATLRDLTFRGEAPRRLLARTLCATLPSLSMHRLRGDFLDIAISFLYSLTPGGARSTLRALERAFVQARWVAPSGDS